MAGTRRAWKGQNMEINEKHALVRNVNKCNKWTKIDQDYIFLDETGCILNEKMMPDVTIMVPELEIVKNVSKTHISMDKRGGTRNFQTLHPPTLQFLSCVPRTFPGQALTWEFL
jgi:hypothetical protein